MRRRSPKPGLGNVLIARPRLDSVSTITCARLQDFSGNQVIRPRGIQQRVVDEDDEEYEDEEEEEEEEEEEDDEGEEVEAEADVQVGVENALRAQDEAAGRSSKKATQGRPRSLQLIQMDLYKMEHANYRHSRQRRMKRAAEANNQGPAVGVLPMRKQTLDSRTPSASAIMATALTTPFSEVDVSVGETQGSSAGAEGGAQAVSWSPDGLLLVVATRTHLHFYLDASVAAPMLLRAVGDDRDDDGVQARAIRMASRRLAATTPQLVHTFREPIFFVPQTLVLTLFPANPAAAATSATELSDSPSSSTTDSDNVLHRYDVNKYIMIVGGAAGAEVYHVSVRVWLQPEHANTNANARHGKDEQQRQQEKAPKKESGNANQMHHRHLESESNVLLRRWSLTGSVKVESVGMTVAHLQVCAVECDSKHGYLAVATLDGHISVWNLAAFALPTPTIVHREAWYDLVEGTDRITCVRFSPDGTRLLVACWNGLLVVYHQTSSSSGSAGPGTWRRLYALTPSSAADVSVAGPLPVPSSQYSCSFWARLIAAAKAADPPSSFGQPIQPQRRKAQMVAETAADRGFDRDHDRPGAIGGPTTTVGRANEIVAVDDGDETNMIHSTCMAIWSPNGAFVWTSSLAPRSPDIIVRRTTSSMASSALASTPAAAAAAAASSKTTVPLRVHHNQSRELRAGSSSSGGSGGDGGGGGECLGYLLDVATRVAEPIALPLLNGSASSPRRYSAHRAIKGVAECSSSSRRRGGVVGDDDDDAEPSPLLTTVAQGCGFVVYQRSGAMFFVAWPLAALPTSVMVPPLPRVSPLSGWLLWTLRGVDVDADANNNNNNNNNDNDASMVQLWAIPTPTASSSSSSSSPSAAPPPLLDTPVVLVVRYLLLGPSTQQQQVQVHWQLHLQKTQLTCRRIPPDPTTWIRLCIIHPDEGWAAVRASRTCLLLYRFNPRTSSTTASVIQEATPCTSVCPADDQQDIVSAAFTRSHLIVLLHRPSASITTTTTTTTTTTESASDHQTGLELAVWRLCGDGNNNNNNNNNNINDDHDNAAQATSCLQFCGTVPVSSLLRPDLRSPHQAYETGAAGVASHALLPQLIGCVESNRVLIVMQEKEEEEEEELPVTIKFFEFEITQAEMEPPQQGHHIRFNATRMWQSASLPPPHATCPVPRRVWFPVARSTSSLHVCVLDGDLLHDPGTVHRLGLEP